MVFRSPPWFAVVFGRQGIILWGWQSSTTMVRRGLETPCKL